MMQREGEIHEGTRDRERQKEHLVLRGHLCPALLKSLSMRLHGREWKVCQLTYRTPWGPCVCEFLWAGGWRCQVSRLRLGTVTRLDESLQGPFHTALIRQKHYITQKAWFSKGKASGRGVLIQLNSLHLPPPLPLAADGTKMTFYILFIKK